MRWVWSWNLRFPIIVLYAGLLHVIWGILLIFHGSIMTVGIAGFLSFGPPPVIGVLMLLVGLSALVSVHIDMRDAYRVMFLIPQQIFLLVSGGEAVRCVLRSSYADGVIRPWAFILADQLPAILIAIMHSLAVAYRPHICNPDGHECPRKDIKQ